MNDSQRTISPDLFKLVGAYTESVRNGAVTDRMTLTADTAIVLFYQAFFHQFFDYLGQGPITGFDDYAKQQAIRIRMSLTGSGAAPAHAVIDRFGEFCDIQHDLLVGPYFKSHEAFLKFHRQYIPDLLRCIGAWATSANLPEVAQRCHDALDAYQDAVSRL